MDKRSIFLLGSCGVTTLAFASLMISENRVNEPAMTGSTIGSDEAEISIDKGVNENGLSGNETLTRLINEQVPEAVVHRQFVHYEPAQQRSQPAEQNRTIIETASPHALEGKEDARARSVKRPTTRTLDPHQLPGSRVLTDRLGDSPSLNNPRPVADEKLSSLHADETQPSPIQHMANLLNVTNQSETQSEGLITDNGRTTNVYVPEVRQAISSNSDVAITQTTETQIRGDIDLIGRDAAGLAAENLQEISKSPGIRSIASHSQATANQPVVAGNASAYWNKDIALRQPSNSEENQNFGTKAQTFPKVGIAEFGLNEHAENERLLRTNAELRNSSATEIAANHVASENLNQSPVKVSDGQLVSVRLDHLISLFEAKMERSLFVWLKDSAAADKYVTPETLRKAGIEIEFKPVSNQLVLSIARSPESITY